MEDHDEDDALERALRELRGDAAGGPQLEDGVVQALQGEGLLRAQNRLRPRVLRWTLAAAAAVACVSFGYLAGRRSTTPAETPMPQFALFLFEDASFDRGDDHVEAARVDEYRHWAERLASEGRLVAGEKLDDGYRVLAAAGEPRGRTGVASASDPGGLLAGYFVIRAESEARATEIALTCPHLRHRGRVVLRRIIET